MTQISAATEFLIRFSNGGRETRVDTYPEAIALLRADGCAEIGHSGDLESGGDRTLAWLTEADSVDDDGARAYASISAVRS